ncbi:MAG TPA: hypothetical protein VGP06_02730 [Janthinobacterium sp.]|jgi:hypothetical protein|nr:hypothetical protein [Janthinobacterium sp.]
MTTDREGPPCEPDARHDAAMESVIERGLQFYETLGKTVAIAYFREQGVPAALFRRVLNPAQGRRAAKGKPPRLF